MEQFILGAFVAVVVIFLIDVILWFVNNKKYDGVLSITEEGEIRLSIERYPKNGRRWLKIKIDLIGGMNIDKNRKSIDLV